MTIRRAVHCGWQCIHLESTNNRGFNYRLASPPPRESFVFNFFGLHCLVISVRLSFGALSCVLILIVPIRRKSNPMWGKRKDNKRKPQTDNKKTMGKWKISTRRWLQDHSISIFVCWCPFVFRLTSQVLILTKYASSQPWAVESGTGTTSDGVFRDQIKRTLSLILSFFFPFFLLSRTKNPFSWTKPDRYPLPLEAAVFSLVFSY